MRKPSEPGDRASLEAARWLVALEEDPDDADLRSRIEAWRAASPANEAAWTDTTAVYGLMTSVPPQHRERWDDRAAPLLRRSARVARWRVAVAAVTLAVAACLLLVAGPGLLIRLQADQVTSTAELRSFGLEDGSVVRLAPESAIDVRYESGRRRVHLLGGEAFFEVQPNPQRPFTVSAHGIETVVLGTSFNVRRTRDGAEIAVRNGVVRVVGASSSGSAGLQLEAGDWAQVAATGGLERGHVPVEEVAPWLHGQIVARDRVLADVVDDLRRYYAGTIVVADAALRERRVTGVYNLADPVAALRAIIGAHGGSVRQLSPWLLVAF